MAGLRRGDMPRVKDIYMRYLVDGYSAARFYDAGWCNEQLSADRVVTAKIDID
ncbi:hypothetical protein [Pseudomonas oryzihabitans]|uniref:hypothetical protein n=1 Tax=Pseudomonas oryzihabitans TaxID=47885 RepID=UPI001DA52B9C|nr:hypothetical protein [Pseudomonas oryzihabitans]HJE71032.1 hypothetical protein [Pseudomonas oryzihabitans]